ncbi:hypothetical protein IMCC3317_03320 [Kordia antarctica]|uniref:Lipoprotein n=1 Tax=Kordia antarctica TaxID=1218801 RepID=A0A7L4ZFK7_9FLAO|nr:hypothetical protein [Kordia antarctica]QHI34986.1 hypothetical protein IMCC3317_03320 [Kordia antarctica]
MKTIKITISTFIILLFCFACQQKQNKTTCEDLEKKVDSLTSLYADYEKSPIYKFYHILSKEKRTKVDTALIEEYRRLIGKDELVDLYIWDRIHTINTNDHIGNIIEAFEGTYILKPNHNKKSAKITSIEISKDSCFLYKIKKLVKAEKLKFKNSSNKYTKGKIILNNYRISLSDAIHPKIATLDDNLCMDCEQLQFYKTE